MIIESRNAVVKSLVERFVPQNPKNIKSYHELLRIVAEYGEQEVANKLSVHREFVTSWLPRVTNNGSLEIGIEPSAGFIAAALSSFQNDVDIP